MKKTGVLLLVAAALLALPVLALLTINYARAETRGTVPLERLAGRGSQLERAVARAVADSLASNPSLPAREWYARRERSANGDTIRFRIYRARDATILGQMLRPEPVIAGGAIYIVSERMLRGPGIGIR